MKGSCTIEEGKRAKKEPFPYINWMKDFPNGEFPSEATGTAILVIALDTEYQSNYTAYQNLCLSYQYSAYDLQSGLHKSGIFYPDINKNERYSLSQFTKKVLEEMGIKPSTLKLYRIIYVAHFFSAEWSMFSDKKELYMKFEYIRKTLITKHNLKTIMIDENKNEVNLRVEFRDTMLLLPEGYKSLEKASAFIEGYEKIDLAPEIKSHMYQFLQDEPILFEEYAIRDAEVTLRLFIKLQYLLNFINDTQTKLFSTLANATTNDFKVFSQKKFPRLDDKNKIVYAGYDVHKMQFDRLHTLYKKYESIADRSYLGGLNSSYHIGFSQGYTFLDIDFKNAYPTAMNLLKIGNFGFTTIKEQKTPLNRKIEGLQDD